MKKEHTNKIYGVATIYIDEGFYSKKDVLDMLEYFKTMEKRSAQLIKDMEDAQIDTNKN